MSSSFPNYVRLGRQNKRMVGQEMSPRAACFFVGSLNEDVSKIMMKTADEVKHTDWTHEGSLFEASVFSGPCSLTCANDPPILRF